MANVPKANSAPTASPPYLPFSRFLQSLDAVAGSLPPKFDRSTWAGESAYTATLLVTAYQFLALTDAAGVPTELLRRLAGDAASRPATLREALQAGYGDVLRLVAEAESPADLERALSRFPISGATHRKSVSFLLNACAYARLPISAALTGIVRSSHTKAARSVDQSVETTTISVPLRSGGAITLSGRFNPFALSADDRHFVFRLVDQLHAYQESGRDAQPALLDEEEVPF